MTVTRTAPSRELASSSAAEAGVRVGGPGEQSRALFSSPLPVYNGIKSKLLSRRETDFKKKNKKNQEHFKRRKNFGHQHFLFRPEFMNFNQINTGTLGTNIWTIMQNHYYDCSEN